MTKDIEALSKALVRCTKSKLNQAVNTCSQKQIYITLNKSGNNLALTEILDSVQLDISIMREVKYFLKGHGLTSILDSCERFTLGQFIQKLRSLKKAKNVVMDVLNELRRYMYDESLILYFEELFFCIDYSKSTMLSTRGVRRTSVAHYQEYCSLCWRLVNKFKLLNYADSNYYSLHYCHEHHPSQNTNNYHKIRNKLFRVIEHRAKTKELQLLTDIRNKELRRDSGARHIYRLMSSFSQKPPLKKLESELSGKSSWTEFTEALLQKAYIYYPSIEKKISKLGLLNYKNWGEWYLAVMEQLGNSTDIEIWNETDDLIALMQYQPHDCKDNNTSKTVGWIALMCIFARYQAHQNIINYRLNKGPKKGISPEGKKLRTQIKKSARNQIKSSGKINAAEIARKLGISRQRVYVLLKELNLNK